MNLTELEKVKLEAFLERFNRCFDGVIEDIEIKYGNEARWPNVRLSIKLKIMNLKTAGLGLD